LGDSEECNHALVYNYSEQIWYDTPINRSAGFYAGVYRAPVWVDSIVDTNYYGYDYYLQEQGTARVDLQGNSTPISCSFVTPDIGFTSSPLPGSPKQSSGLLQNWVQLMRVEPDGLIEGTWTMEVGIKSNPLAQTQYSQDVKTFTNETLEMDVQEQGRMMFLRFSSQDVASSLFMGDMLLTTYLGDAEGV
jgi:hypothetical protein